MSVKYTSKNNLVFPDFVISHEFDGNFGYNGFFFSGILI